MSFTREVAETPINGKGRALILSKGRNINVSKFLQNAGSSCGLECSRVRSGRNYINVFSCKTRL